MGGGQHAGGGRARRESVNAGQHAEGGGMSRVGGGGVMVTVGT